MVSITAEGLGRTLGGHGFKSKERYQQGGEWMRREVEERRGNERVGDIRKHWRPREESCEVWNEGTFMQFS